MKYEALEVLKNRRAIRNYKAEQIKDEELDLVLEAGTYAPTGMGAQSPIIVAVQDPAELEKVWKLNARIAGSSGNTYYGAPTIVLVLSTGSKTEELAVLDAAAVCTNMLNAAYAVGLGSCWIHRCKEMFDTEEGKELLRAWGLPDTLRGVASIALGYADCEHPKAPPRKENYIVKI